MKHSELLGDGRYDVFGEAVGMLDSLISLRRGGGSFHTPGIWAATGIGSLPSLGVVKRGEV